MANRKFAPKPTDLFGSDCDIIIAGQHLNKLEISPDYKTKMKNIVKV